MKWIGQHIWSFISRFRSDVYLENVTESAQDHVVGIDADGKLYKQDVATGDITGVTAGSGLTGGGDSGGVTINVGAGTGIDVVADAVSVDVSDFMTNGSDNRVVTATGTDAMNAEASFTFDGNDITLGADNDTETKIQKLAHSDNHAGQISIIGANATAGQTDKRGGRIALYTGLATGSSQNGGIDFYTALSQGSTGNSLSSYQLNPMASFYSTADSGVFDMYEAAGSTSNDRFRINVEAAGSTTLSTLDGSGGVAAVLNLDADGLIILDSARNGSISLRDAGTTYGSFDTAASTTNFLLYEAGGASFNDYFKISIATKGNTTISTVDAAGSDADLTLDIDGDIELNADGGTIVFKDDTATLATIDTNGISFLDNTAAGVRFEGTTDDAHNTVLLATDPTGARICMLPDASGTLALLSNIEKHVHVQIKDFGSYLFYLFNDDSWYSAGSTTLAILGSSTSPGDLSSSNSKYQGRIASYTAPAACTLKKLCFSFYWTSSAVNSADIDFAFSKFTPISNGSSATITMNSITATDNDGSYTENAPYYLTFDFSGGNASLSAGDSFAFHMRTTGGSSSQRILVYGQAILSVELS
tara:strand:+ start:3550 stop:5319 length:1770 start_codon:yes stop_codon:yes gene_type:complete